VTQQLARLLPAQLTVCTSAQPGGEAKVPMALVNREPPTWTDEQRAAVLTYANAWMWLQWARES
jgi:hypothetical protein